VLEVDREELLDGRLVFDDQDVGGHRERTVQCGDGQIVWRPDDSPVTVPCPAAARPPRRFVIGFAARAARAAKETPMAGLDRTTPAPTEIKLHQKSRVMELTFADGKRFTLSYEFLRVYSPSAEVRGHGPGQEVLQTGKKDVEIVAVEPVGSYAIQPRFSDGHDTGIYSWDYLYELGLDHERLWAEYLKRMAAAGASREPGAPAKPAPPPGRHGH
jgi:DUF971 family protein